MRRTPRERGKTGLSKLLYEYKLRQKVVVMIDPSIHRGMPHRRYHGKIGTITEKRGRAYLIEIPQGKVVKNIITLPEHMKPYMEG
jgi:large subunit ribosomal protein L21e